MDICGTACKCVGRWLVPLKVKASSNVARHLTRNQESLGSGGSMVNMRANLHAAQQKKCVVEL